MSKKSTYKVLSVLILAILVLSACGQNPGTGIPAPGAVDAPSQPSAPDVPVAKPSGKLVIWAQAANQDVWEQTILDGFKAEYPDIEIEFVNYGPPEVANQVGLAIQGGTGVPDLAVTEYRSITALVELGGLMDMTAFMEPYKNDMNASMLAYCSKDGKMYCAPWDIGPVVTFYRRDIFEAAGLPSDPDSVGKLVATYDDYLATCKTIKAETGLNCFALNKANNYGTMLENMLWQQGLGFYDETGKVTIDAPYVIDAMKKLGAFWEADVVSDSLEWTDPWYAEMNASIDNQDTPPVASIVIGAWMGNFLKSWIAADQAGNWGVTQMPAYTAGGIRASNQGGSAYFIPDGSKNPEAAKAFIEYVNSNIDNQVAQFVYSDYFPANQATYSDPVFQEIDPYFGGQATRLVFAESARNIPFGYIYGQYAVTMSGNAATALQNYALGNMSAEQALKEAANAVRLETGLP
jgi:lactose/L-arabinose transport system substrate-binding protein